MRRSFGILLAAGVVGGTLALGASPASASLDGPCEASGTFGDGGMTVDAKTTDEVEIPRKDTVAWVASVPAKEGERPISGDVRVEFPPPIGEVTVGDWSSDSSTYSNSDVYEYDLPSVIAGFDIPVSGIHRDAGFTCSGTVIVRVEGGGLKNPAALASLAFTFVSLVGVSLAIRVRP